MNLKKSHQKNDPRMNIIARQRAIQEKKGGKKEKGHDRCAKKNPLFNHK
jgi:hypothetical protein